MHWPDQSFPFRTGLGGKSVDRVQNIFGTSEINFLKNPRCTFLCMYNVHCNTYIFKDIVFLFFWTLEGGRGLVNPMKAYHRRIANLEIVTVHRRSDSKRAYRSPAFF